MIDSDEQMNLRHINAADRRKEGWSMGREIVGTIIGVLAVVIPVVSGLVVWGTHVESILTLHTAEIVYLHKENDTQDKAFNLNTMGEERRLQRIEDKVDKLIERK